MSDPEPGTTEWFLETGNYIEPDWDAGEPYTDPARGTVFRDTPGPRAGSEAWLAAGPDAYEKEATAAYRHCAEQDAQVWAGPEAEAE